MSHAERARGYHLLSQLLLRGPAGVRVEDLRAIDPDPPHPEALESSYVAAFDLGVPPYASAFLQPNGRTGGATTRAIADQMHATPQQLRLDVAPCHLGLLLAHLGHLTARGDRSRAGSFAVTFVLSWLPTLAAAVERLELPFWGSALTTALDLVADEARSTDTAPTSAPADREAHPLDDPGSGLRDVAHYLGYPARCGFFLTDHECGMLGRALDLPRGFGSRRQRIETLLRSGAEYGALPSLCRRLDAIAEQRASRLGALAEGRYDPTHNSRWQTRIDQTRRMLSTLEAGAESLRSSGT